MLEIAATDNDEMKSQGGQHQMSTTRCRHREIGVIPTSIMQKAVCAYKQGHFVVLGHNYCWQDPSLHTAEQHLRRPFGLSSLDRH